MEDRKRRKSGGYRGRRVGVAGFQGPKDMVVGRFVSTKERVSVGAQTAVAMPFVGVRSWRFVIPVFSSVSSD